MLTPFGSITAHKNAISVQDLAGNVAKIKQMLDALNEPKPEKPAAEKTYAFAFKDAKWEEVFNWYSKHAGCALAAPVSPKGTFTSSNKAGKEVTIGEVTDLINESLLAQKLLLVRRHTTYVVVPAEKIDAKFVPAVELKDLPARGRTELVEVAMTLRGIDAEEVSDELKKLLTSFGEILLAKGKWLVVRDTAGNVARIRETLDACSRPIK